MTMMTMLLMIMINSSLTLSRIVVPGAECNPPLLKGGISPTVLLLLQQQQRGR